MTDFTFDHGAMTHVSHMQIGKLTYHEFHCSQCGRRLMVCFRPYRKEVIEEGDKYAMHTAAIGGLTLSGRIDLPDPPEPPEPA